MYETKSKFLFKNLKYLRMNNKSLKTIILKIRTCQVINSLNSNLQSFIPTADIDIYGNND